ncbi:hypothetical protein ACT3QR_08965 [Psychrobacter sp. AOP7-B1-25]|uniref:hypothetical protein n=1 Tax=Psychrobacter sp. AOP7-B1-25 TaxID=3457644 RepID=UPI00402BC04A
MNIIDQLEQTVTPAVMGNDDSNNIAYVSLLEQFYAVLAARLAGPQIYSQMLRNDQITTSSINESSLFEQLWQDKNLRETMVQELAASHHIDAQTTEQLITSAAPLAYRELKILANGQFLPAFLQEKQATLRPYLPIWAAAMITATQDVHQQVQTSFNSDDDYVPVHVPVIDDISNRLDDAILDTGIVAPITNNDVESIEPISIAERASTEALGDDTIASSDAVHANPAAYLLSENSNLKRAQVRTRNQRNDLLIRVFLLIVALAALALAAWALLVKPNNEIPVEPVVTAPVEPPSTPEPQMPTTTPIELIIGVDNGGNLYTCSATVGNAALQSSLQQALNTSFGEQASICELNIQDGVASTITNMPTEVLPNVLTMLRSTPFARLHVQNDRLTLEAPDNMLLQKLVTEIRNLAPAMIVESTAPLPLPDNNDTGNTTNNMANENNQFADDGEGVNNQFNSNVADSNSVEYQASDDDTGDGLIPTPLPNNNSFNNTPSDPPTNGASNIPKDFPSNNQTTRPPGPFSPSEVDEMANTIIVAEPAQVR